MGLQTRFLKSTLSQAETRTNRRVGAYALAELDVSPELFLWLTSDIESLRSFVHWRPNMLSSEITALPPEARALTALGDETTNAVLDLYYQPQGMLFPATSEPMGFVELEYALRKMEWPDAQCAALLHAYKQAV